MSTRPILALALALLPCVFAQLVPGTGRIGASPKEVLGSKTVETIKKQAAQSAPSTVAQAQASAALIRRQIQELTAVDAKLGATLSAIKNELDQKDMSRVAVLETKVDTLLAAAQQQRVDHDATMGKLWDITRLFVFPVATSIFSALWIWWRSRKQEKHLEAQDVRVEAVHNSVAKLEKNTDGLLKNVLKLTGDKAFVEGHDAGVQEEQDIASKSVRGSGKLGRDL